MFEMLEKGVDLLMFWSSLNRENPSQSRVNAEQLPTALKMCFLLVSHFLKFN